MVKNQNNTGFTLVELSIVLVIIGLIVGGVVGGQSLIQSGKINGQVRQIQQYETAYRAFQLQYDAIPGDMVNAWDYWGTDCAANQANCNGDGNNKLDTVPDGPASYEEGMMFFAHLGLANIIPEKYDGTNTASSLGTGYPRLAIDKSKGMLAGNSLRGPSTTVGDGLQLPLATVQKEYKAVLYMNIGWPTHATPNWRNDDFGTMTAKQASTIDRKIDDGDPTSGRYLSHLAWTPVNGNCLTGLSGNYLQSNTLPACHSFYILE